MKKVKRTVTGAKDKVRDAGETTKDKMASSTNSAGSRVYEQGAAGTETAIRDDPLTEYREKEPMTPAKIKIHEHFLSLKIWLEYYLCDLVHASNQFDSCTSEFFIPRMVIVYIDR